MSTDRGDITPQTPPAPAVPIIEASLVAGVPVDLVSMAEALDLIDSFVETGRETGRSFQVATVNVDFVVNALHDPELRDILGRADLCVADGMPILWYSRARGTTIAERVAGADLVPGLVERAAVSGRRVLLFGSTAGVAEAAADLLLTRFPAAQVLGISGPMMRTAGQMETVWLEEIKRYDPDVICVALGNPKQEHWIEAFRAELGVPVLIGVGGTLDFLVGTRRRAPDIAQRNGFEWLYRAAQEPRRLGRRYLRDGVKFGPQLIRATHGGRRDRHRRGWLISWDDDGVVIADLGKRPTARDVDTLVGLARDGLRSGRRLVIRGCSERTRSELQRLELVKVLDIA